MSNKFYWIGIVLLIALTAGCSTFQGLAPDESADWAFQGKMSIKNETEASSFNVTWQQFSDEFDIELSGPLGQGRISIHGDRDQVTLTQGSDQWTASNLEDLLWNLQQIQLPLDYLQYWVRAVPKPAEPYNRKLSSHSQQVIELKQAGWRVNYSSYHEEPPFMPEKLSFTKEDRSGKLVIREWSLLQSPPS